MRGVERLGDAPIITPDSHPSVGHNIQGPSVVRTPPWVSEPLGRYLLYFADHKGSSIRLAYADAPAGPWTVHPPGSLGLEHSCFLTAEPELDDATLERIETGYRRALGDDQMPDDLRADLVTPHIASPDVHVDHEREEIVMYFHGLEAMGEQSTRVATSRDGISFDASPEILGPSYFRVFRHDGWWYALAMPGVVLRSADGRTGFETGPRLFVPEMRHSAVRVEGDRLDVLWTRVGDEPERILHSVIDLDRPWSEWSDRGLGPDGEPLEVLRPERSWEGAELPPVASRRGAVDQPVHQLRDPCLFSDVVDGVERWWLFYAVAGESGIAVAEVHG